MKLKIPGKFKAIVFAAIMSLFTVMLVSGVLTWRHYGQEPGFLLHWFTAFISAWPLVFVAILVVAPAVNKLVDSIVD
jgi:hypothetical protein